MSIFGIRPPWWATLGLGLVATSVISAWVKAKTVQATGRNIDEGDYNFTKVSFGVGAVLVAIYLLKRARGG
jgi:hypothetical protein